jgi:hypothetical protein
MHDYHRDKGVPENAEFVTSGVDSLPSVSGDLDKAASTMRYHEPPEISA